MKPHPISEIFPLCSKDELEALTESIRQHGQRDPIVLHQGKILDGRNRYAACKLAGVKPKTVEFSALDTDHFSPTEYVMDKNLRRRHMTISQRAVAAANALPFYEAEAKERLSTRGKKTSADELALEPAPEPPADLHGLYGVLDHNGVRTVPASEVPTSEDLIQDPTILAVCGPRPFQPGEDPTEIFREQLRSSTDYLTPAATKLMAAGEGGQIDEALAIGMKQQKSTGKKAGKTTGKTTGNSRAPKSTEKAGKTFKVSGKMVQQAKKLQELDPKAYARVEKGETTLNAELSRIEAQQAKKEQDEQETEDALTRIRLVCGKDFGDSVRKKDRLPNRKDVLAYAALDDDKMIALRGLLVEGWKLKAAMNYKFIDMSRTHRITDLLVRTAANGGNFTFEVEGYRITCQKIENPTAAAKKKLEALKHV